MKFKAAVRVKSGEPLPLNWSTKSNKGWSAEGAMLTVAGAMGQFLWKQKQDIGPQPRCGHAMAFDAERGVVLLFGGKGGASLFDDTWAWDGALWTQVADTGPAARSGHAMAFDVMRTKVVLFGGADGGTSLGDTWEWDGDAWTEIAEMGPPVRSGHAMCFDSARKLTVLFGGKGATGLTADTWGWDGEDWTELKEVGPSSRQGHMMAFDAVKGRALLFGGTGADGTGLGDTWAWNGTNWTELQNIGPGHLVYAAMVFAKSSAVLFGGVDSIDPMAPAAAHKLNDNTWQLQADHWTKVQDIGPSPRWRHAMAFDTQKNRVVLFGGLSVFAAEGDPALAGGLQGDTWEHTDDSAPPPPNGGGDPGITITALTLNSPGLPNISDASITASYTLSAPAPAGGLPLNAGVFSDQAFSKPVSQLAISVAPVVAAPGQTTGTFFIVRRNDPLAFGVYFVAVAVANTGSVAAAPFQLN